jgi:hypothetical protein
MEKEWVFPKLADEIVRWIYVGDGINRVFYEDYVKFFGRRPSGFDTSPQCMSTYHPMSRPHSRRNVPDIRSLAFEWPRSSSKKADHAGIETLPAERLRRQRIQIRGPPY